MEGSLDDLRKYVKGTDFHTQAIVIKRVNQLVQRFTRRSSKVEGWEVVLRFTGQKISVPKTTPDVITKLVRKINASALAKNYPMLTLMEYRSWNRNASYYKTLGEYIKMMDEQSA